MYQTIIRQMCKCIETIITWGLRGIHFFMQHLMNIYNKLTQTTCSQVLKDKMDPQNMWRVLFKTFGIHKHTTHSSRRWSILYKRQHGTVGKVSFGSSQSQYPLNLLPHTSSCMILGRTSHASVCKMEVMTLPTPSAVLQIMWNDARQTHGTLPDTC